MVQWSAANSPEAFSMHELSLTQSLVELCLEHAAGRRVTAVTLLIGDLAGVEPEAMAFCFEACTAGTLLEGSRLVIERCPATGACADCGASFSSRRWFAPCTNCGSLAVTCQGGDELRVKDLEVE
jgi:hydrogenase nickel incorporation protein HypA/HybF